MSRFPEFLAAAALSLTIAAPLAAQDMGLGRAATPDEIAAWDIDVRPDGMGLPAGSGSVLDGEDVFVEKCAACHGDFGEGVDRWPVLAGGQGTLTRTDPVKTIGSYWPYLSTVWDYVHRAMPFGQAQSLTPDEVYALTAYILYVNDVVEDEEFVLSDANFTEITMPNEGGFYPDDRETTEPFFGAEVCMQDCKETVEITARARIIDVTPEETAAREAAAGAEAATETATETAAAQPEPAETGPSPELVAAGESVFRQCKACHQVGDGAKNRVGPHLNGIVGRAAGSVEGFRYSNTLAEMGETGLVWSDETLNAFLTDPKGYVPKTKMVFKGLKSEDDIRAVLAYLQAEGG